MRNTLHSLVIATAACLTGSAASGVAIPLRYADSVVAYNQGPSPQPGYTTPEAAIGQPSTGHSPATPMNNDPQSGAPNVVSLGQGGSITLSFNAPVRNQSRSAANPYGYDLLVWGNAFENSAIGENARFQEQGFIEVAKADASGQPAEWFLILPRIFYDPVRGQSVPRDFTPAELLPPILEVDEDGNKSLVDFGDLSISPTRFDGFADSVPARGSQLQKILTTGQLADVVLDDPATYAIEGLGGTGVDLTRAVRQTSPGVPLLIEGQVEFVPLDGIRFMRITDARMDDEHPAGWLAITTEVDGVIVLPDLRGCTRPFADADHDGDVDADDFGAFQVCYSGAGRQAALECACFDRNGDNDVDDEDLAAFRVCVLTSGPGIPANPACGD